jgi:acylphosphatase
MTVGQASSLPVLRASLPEVSETTIKHAIPLPETSHGNRRLEAAPTGRQDACPTPRLQETPFYNMVIIKILLCGRFFGFMPAVSSAPPVAKRHRMTVFYSGHVQGVGFRYNAKKVATGFEATGTVRNLDDGRVELMAEGLREELEAFREAIRDSGLAGFIRDEKVVWSDAKNEFRGFEIIV